MTCKASQISDRSSVRYQHFQNLKAPRMLGRRRWNLACIKFIGRGTQLLGSGILNFGPCSMHEWLATRAGCLFCYSFSCEVWEVFTLRLDSTWLMPCHSQWRTDHKSACVFHCHLHLLQLYLKPYFFLHIHFPGVLWSTWSSVALWCLL